MWGGLSAFIKLEIIIIVFLEFLIMDGKDDYDRKSSTMNSMFIGSTISKPNTDSIINAVATILHSQMLEVSLPEEPTKIGSRIRQNYTLGQRFVLLF